MAKKTSPDLVIEYEYCVHGGMCRYVEAMRAGNTDCRFQFPKCNTAMRNDVLRTNPTEITDIGGEGVHFLNSDQFNRTADPAKHPKRQQLGK